MFNRRDFIRKGVFAGGLLIAGSYPFESLAGVRRKSLTILHTNDVHSHLDAFPMDGGKFQGQGGIVARAALIEKIRSEEKHVLLLDAGDIFQGTPYFNLYKGEPEIKAMSMMGYDACTMGNHDFDNGIEGFANQLPLADFPVLTANYDFADTALEHKTKPYIIIRKGGLKIGVFGVGIELEGLVNKNNFGNTKYLEPIQIAKQISQKLKKIEKCDLVICLSHLGYKYTTNKVSDEVLAKETEYIDLIIGGHTHTFLDKPAIVMNRSGNNVLINQVGWAGLRLGRLDFEFYESNKVKLSGNQSISIG